MRSDPMKKRPKKKTTVTTTKNKTGPGKGPVNLSGSRGPSPVLRVRVTPDLMRRAEKLASEAGLTVADWVRSLIERTEK